MPLNKINYDNTCFYKIVCKDLSIKELYVGHTTDWVSRKSKHKRHATKLNSNRSQCPVYTFIREHGGWDNFDMILLERCKCDDELDARKKERHYIEQLNASLNVYIPGRTKSEYYQDKKKYTINKSKKYYENNTETCKEWKNTLVECECGFNYTNANKARHEKSNRHQNLNKKLVVQE